MTQSSRRAFLAHLGVGIGAAGTLAGVSLEGENGSPLRETSHPTEIDFRYSPLSWQTAFCFPDDPHKSLIGERGELRYGHPGLGDKGDRYFPEIVEFAVDGMEAGKVQTQFLEAPGIPIVHTRVERTEVLFELTTFATNLAGEGRVDNVIFACVPRTRQRERVRPRITIRTGQDVSCQNTPEGTLVHLGKSKLFLVVSVYSPEQKATLDDLGTGCELWLADGWASYEKPLRFLARFPQEGQGLEQIRAGLQSPDELLNKAREYWGGVKLFKDPARASFPGRYGEFMVACAQNILQAREIKEGRVNFQVGPTVYRGLWVVDGNFLLEAARYLGYDSEAQQGLEATWARQTSNGGIFAGGGEQHWKDTGIAMFSLVRQAELAQDWSYFRKMQPEVLRAGAFLQDLRVRARKEGSTNGRYGLLAAGFGDGGLADARSELTNTIWVLAGLKAVVNAAEQNAVSGFDPIKALFEELNTAFTTAAAAEMRQHSGGFKFLPMLVKDDPAWSAPDPWDRPQPQVAQWALSHAIYPGLLFDKADPIVRGHIALMQACTQEDVPAETGWTSHEGLWGYNAAFVAQVYLWAGLADWAHRTFVGFLNHATPLYCWREEQGFRYSVVANASGDMPHNWASAQCVRYLRHMLAMEDGPVLRLLPGITGSELELEDAYEVEESPTRFGRVSLKLEPLPAGRGWHATFRRGKGPPPESVQIPSILGGRYRFANIKGAQANKITELIQLSPDATSWEATWTPGGTV